MSITTQSLNIYVFHCLDKKDNNQEKIGGEEEKGSRVRDRDWDWDMARPMSF